VVRCYWHSTPESYSLWSHVKVVTMTAEVISQVNHLGRNKTSLVLTFQNRSGEEIGKGNMLNCIHNNSSNTGEDPDVVDNLTGVIQPYEEYVDKWNMGVPENLVEVQEGDGHIDQVMETTKNPFSGVEDTLEFETVDAEYETHFESEFESRMQLSGS